MSTFFEILVTALLTFFAGFLFIRYKPKKKGLNFRKNGNDTTAWLMFLTGISVFSVVSYLVTTGVVIIKW